MLNVFKCLRVKTDNAHNFKFVKCLRGVGCTLERILHNSMSSCECMKSIISLTGKYRTQYHLGFTLGTYLSNVSA